MNRRRLVLTLFAAVVLAQIAVPVWAILRMEMPLRGGTPFRFRVDLEDPYDPFRGRYLALRLEEWSAPVPEDEFMQGGQSVFAVIEEGPDGFARVGGVSRLRPDDALYVRASVQYVADDRAWLDLPFRRYYMDEGALRRAESALSRADDSAEVYVLVRVSRGVAALEELYVNGVPIAEYIEAAPWSH